MESTDGHDANNAASTNTDVELIEEETNFANEVSDGELEAAASRSDGNIHFSDCSLCLSILLIRLRQKTEVP